MVYLERELISRGISLDQIAAKFGLNSRQLPNVLSRPSNLRSQVVFELQEVTGYDERVIYELAQ